MKKAMLAVLLGLVGLLVSCASTPSFENFQNDPTYSQNLVGSWKQRPVLGSYEILVLNDDGTGSETIFNRKGDVVVKRSFQYKVSATQFMLRVINPQSIIVYNYQFIDDDTFSLFGGGRTYYSAYDKIEDVQSANDTRPGVEGALARAAQETLKNVPAKSKIAIMYITAQDRSTTEYIVGELEFIWVNEGYFITDRSQLDRLRNEQNFQMSGEVDDATAVSIGKFAGADIIVTGRVDGEGDLRRLRLRALNTQTAQVVGVASERL